MAEGEKALGELREQVDMEILAQKFLRSVVKRECWDSMAAAGRTLFEPLLSIVLAVAKSSNLTFCRIAFEKKLEVLNFPLRRKTAAEQRILARVLATRQREQCEARALATYHASRMHTFAPRESMWVDNLTPMAGGRHGDGSVAAMSADEEAAVAALYNPLHLHSALRKRAQIVLLQDLIFHFKARFNREFDDLLHGKADEIAKIAERNAKISKIAAELHIAVILTPIVYHASEHPEVPRDFVIQKGEKPFC